MPAGELNQKMLSEKPLKIPLFPIARGRGEIDQLLGISIEQLTKQVPFLHIPHRHDFYVLLWIESGDGTFVSDGRSYPLAPGCLILVPPGQVHGLEMERHVERLCSMF
jgi:mannose-6-phosphate isomerase-like protein (cupin superfamily)